MKRLLPLFILAFAAAWLLAAWWPQKNTEDGFDLTKLGKIPVLVGGRLKPLDTVARNSLVIIRGRQTLRLADGTSIIAMRWLADVIFNAPVADRQPTFVINNPEVLGLFGWQQDERKYFNYEELTPFLQKIDEQGTQSEKVEAAQRSPYQIAIINLRNSLILYQRLKNSVQPERAQDFADEIEAYATVVAESHEAAFLKSSGKKFDAEKLELVKKFADRYETMAAMAYILAVPPSVPGPQSNEWTSTGEDLMRAATTGGISPVLKTYAFISDAYRAGDTTLFNQRVDDLAAWMKKNEPHASGRASYEHLFNFLAPFYQSMTLYVLAFLLACGSWLGLSRTLTRSAFYLLLLALAIHTFGLVSRMYLQERPPVTNLYSSAIFIGWGTVIIGLILERIYRDGIGAACAGAIGFITLIIAHNLAGSGDTLEMLQAVLDTNIWLATHVVVVTTGYSAMFLAGMLAILYVVRGVFTKSLTREVAQSLTRMTYGVVCFATLFSFVGTVLGGIWADQSWGRFWGWDPKENGALLIVLWCAIILHARWGGFIKQRGLMVMALFGNVITSFSWFGVNMLGVGLHSYGFMNKAFPWLAGYVLSQLALMVVASLPLDRWRSFQSAKAPLSEEEAVAL
jgi:ABC-type transport system involved in cytochrome c biogenesis permease subunit